MTANELPPPVQFMKLLLGKWINKPICVAAELGIADILAEGPMSIADLAESSRTHAPSLYRLMRALASVGIFSETEDEKFQLTPMAECLRTGAMRPVALMFNAAWHERAWAHLIDSVRTGVPAFEKAHGMPICDYLKLNPQASELLSEANAVKAVKSHRAIVDVYDFSGTDTLTDIGGGYGALTAEILIANPSMKGIVADRAPVIEGARRMLQARGVADRCEVVECDFFEEIPAGGDVYLMSHILHNWPDRECEMILENCRRAMKPQSRLLIVEIVIPGANQPSVGNLLDLEMLVISGGRERTAAEFRELLEGSGFRLSRVIPTKESICVIEGVPL
jgi:ubiquinone/menaquinone biosynthesis C-methylase UbiE